MKRVLSKVVIGLTLSAVAALGAGCDEEYGSYSSWGFGLGAVSSFGGIGDYFESAYESFEPGFFGDGGYYEGGYEESYEEGYWWEDDWKKRNPGRRK